MQPLFACYLCVVTITVPVVVTVVVPTDTIPTPLWFSSFMYCATYPCCYA